MSMPWTCPHSDWLMYILYSSDSHFMSQIISTSLANIESEHGTSGIADALRAFEPAPTDCLHMLRIKLFLLLDQDEATRRRLCTYTSPLVRNYTPVNAEKAGAFYTELHETLIPDWVKDETIAPGDFVDAIRMAYLIS